MRKILVLLIFPLFALSFAQTEMWTWNCGTPTAESSADSVTFSGDRDILLYRNQKAVLRRQVDSITFAAPAVLQLPIVQCVNLELGEMPDRCNGGIQSPLLTTDVTCNPYKSDGVTVALSWSDDGMAFGTNTNWFAIDLTAHPDTLIRAASVRVRMNRYQEGTHDHIFVKYAPDQEPQSVAVSSLVTSGEIIDLTPTSPTSYLWIARGSATTTLFSDLCLTLSKKGDDTEPVDPPTPVVIPTLSGLNLTQGVKVGEDIVPVVITADGSDVVFDLTPSELPEGLTAQTEGDKISISGAPVTAGTYSIDVTATRGSLVSDPLTITLTVAPGEASVPVLKGRNTIQTITLGDAIQEISVWSTNADAESWTIDPATLPDGITMTQTGNTLYFNGTPTTIGYNSFSVVANAGLQSSDALPVSVLVKTDQAPVLTSSNVTQTIEAGSAIRSISITSDIDAEFAITNLPSGLSQSVSGKTLTITGNISQTGTYTFDVTAEADGLTSTPVTVNIEVLKPKAAPVLTFETSSDVSVIVNRTMPVVTFISDSVLSYTEIEATGLPTGIILTEQGGNRFSLSGTPLKSGNYVYSIAATKNGLTSIPIKGTIVVLEPQAPVVTVTPSTQSVTSGTPITPIVFTSDSSDVIFEVSTLPSGLSSTNDGKTLTVSGTATATGVSSISVTATKNGKTSTASVSTLTVTAKPVVAPVLSIVSGSLTQTVKETNAISNVVIASDSLVTLTATGLPSGISISPVTASHTFTLSGVPSSVGVHNVSLSATKNGKTSNVLTGTITVMALAAPVVTVTPLTQSVTSGTPITPIVFTSDSSDVIFEVSTLPSGLSSTNDGKTLTVSGTATATGVSSISVTATKNGKTSTASVSTLTVTAKPVVASVLSIASGSLTQTVKETNAISNVVIKSDSLVTLTATGLPSGISISPVTASHTFTLSGVPSSVGVHNVSLSATKNGKTSNVLTGTITVMALAAPVVTVTPSTQSVTSGTPITPIVFTSDSSDVSFEVSTLPSGLSSTNDGKTLTVSGTATATGVSSISVTATKNGKTSTASVSTLTVTAKPVVAPVLSIVSGSLTQTVKETNAISNVVIESDSLVTLTATGLPSGISISPVTASHTFTLSGVPSSVGVHNVSLSATKNGKTSNVLTGTITVMALAAPVVTVTPLTQSVTSGTPITPIVFTSDSSDVIFEVSTLPSGLSSTNDGKTLTVSGTATATGVSSISVTATKHGKTSTASVSTLTVTEPLLPLTITVTGGSATQTVGVGESLTTITFTASESSALLYISPDKNISGITIGDPNMDNTSSISGTPAATGVINYTVHAETTDGRTAQLSGKITVANATGPVLYVEPIGEQPPAAELLNQTVTAGSSIENINIRSDIPATMTVTGLPAGVQGLQSSTSETVMTIQGKPTVSGTFNFTVSAVGKENGMSSQNVIQGTLKVIGAPVLTIKTGGETTSNLNQTVEKGDAISTIVISSDVSAIWSATGLADAGLSAETSADYKTYTITGTPSSIMNYPISVTAKTSNLETTVSGTITVKAKTPTVKTKTYTVGSVSFKTVEIEGGTFQMGSSGTGIPMDESPIHSVTVSDYEMGQTEVTQGLWVAVLGETNKPKWNANYGMTDAYPVYNVNYDRIVNEFLPALNAKLHESGQLAADKQFTLPTEAEWEYAARGGRNSAGYTYSGGNNLGDVAYYTENNNSSGHKAFGSVAGKAANESGLYDMSGNVSEWCYDWYGNYSSTSQTNPIGVAKGTNGNQNGNKVLRGGNINSSATECRVSARKAISHSASSGVNYYGFRLVLDGITKSQSDLNE